MCATTNKLGRLLPGVLILAFFSQNDLFSQDKKEIGRHPAEPKLRLPIQRDKFKNETYSLEDEFANLISEVAHQLFLDEMIVCIQVDPTPDVSDMPSGHIHIINWEEMNGYSEALVLTGTSLAQTEISKSREDGDFVETDGQHSKHVITKLNLSAYFLDIKTGENLGPFDLEVLGSARTQIESRSRVLNCLKKRLIAELKKIYWLSSDVASIMNDRITIPLGSAQSLKKGLIFELVVPESILAIYDENCANQPKTVGLASVIETSTESSTLKVFRKWDSLHERSWVVEHFNPSYALELFYVPPIAKRYFCLGIDYHARPFHVLDFGGGFQFVRLTDSFGDDDYGVGFSGFGIWRWMDKPGLNIGTKLGANLDIPFKKDDMGSTVFTALLSFNVGILSEIAITRRFDIVINAGYRLAIKSDKWTYSEADDSYPAFWEGAAPVVDNSGMYYSAGFHYLLF